MSDIVTPEGLTRVLTDYPDPDNTYGEVGDGSADNAKINKTNEREFMTEKIRTGLSTMNPRLFTAGRFDSVELVSTSLGVSGWYTIAETGTTASRARGAKFKIASSGGSQRRDLIEFQIKIISEGNARTHENTVVELLKPAKAAGSLRIKGVRLAKSDSVSTSGQKVQVNLDISTDMTLYMQMSDNLGGQGDAGFQLVSPTQTDINLLPDGITVPTFLEAGEEFTFGEVDAHFISGWTANRISNDVIACELNMEQIPKQFTGITLTLPSTSLEVVDKSVPATTFTLVSPTFSNFGIKGNRIQFRMNETGIATGMTAGELGFLCTGTGGDLTLT